MSTVTADFGWFPLVPRPRPPALPLDQRITELTSISVGAGEGTVRQRATRAAAVLNNAALIASDCGVTDLALTLCCRQYELFVRCAPLPGWAARLALQPVLNIPRQLVRDGQGDDAHAFLRALHQAAADRSTVSLGGINIDFAALTGTRDAHKEALTLTWTALLADGTRALARAGRWREAARYAAANHGTGTRLLDGRQAAVLALLTDGQPAQAVQLVDRTIATELWERAVQTVLRVMCQHARGKRSRQDTASMTVIAEALAKEPDPATAVTRTRIGLTAGRLADGLDTADAHALSTVLLTTASTDAYAARDLLASPLITSSASDSQLSDLRTLIQASGLGTGTIPGHLRSLLTSAADRAATTLALTRPADMATVCPVTITASFSDEDRARQLRGALADHIKSFGTFRNPQVETAFRTVPRHVFLPGSGLEEAYSRNPVVTRRAPDGTSLSSASSPKLVATMLEQLEVRPGQRLLEIGAATGFNAALLAELTGPTGTVVTIELDDDLAAEAAANLSRAGYPDVHVVCGDGALGHPGNAPYERIIVTAEAWDITPQWWGQLGPDGHIVVPIRLHGSGLTRSVAFRRRDPRTLVSASAAVCGFVPMRGISEHAGQRIQLAGDVVLKVDAADRPDRATLAQALSHPAAAHWTGIPVRHDDPVEHLDLWLATTATEASFARLTVTQAARDRGLADPARRWAGASLYQGGTLAYITARAIDDDTNELGVTVHGPDSTELAETTVSMLSQWHRQRPAQPVITAFRAPADLATMTGTSFISRPQTVFSIAWLRSAARDRKPEEHRTGPGPAICIRAERDVQVVRVCLYN